MKTKVIANRLSIIFGGPHTGACGCAGVSCGNTCCERWWEIVFQDEEIRAKAIKLYDDHKEEINTGALKILAKRFLIEDTD